MKVVRLLERKEVIRLFGGALVLAPFVNYFMHVLVIKTQSGVAWSQFQYFSVLRSTHAVSFFLAACSLVIGLVMLSGRKSAWRWVMGPLGAHLGVQILNIGNEAWKGPLAWPSFILNAGLLFFILDQLVWKVSKEDVSVPAAAPVPTAPEKHRVKVVNLKSYRKILFSFGSTRPWGELKTLSSEVLAVKPIAAPPENIANKVVQINFSKDVVVDIRYKEHDQEYYYFSPLNMDKEKVTKLNKWLKKIAV